MSGKARTVFFVERFELIVHKPAHKHLFWVAKVRKNMSRRAILKPKVESVSNIVSPHKLLSDGGEEIIANPLYQINVKSFLFNYNFRVGIHYSIA